MTGSQRHHAVSFLIKGSFKNALLLHVCNVTPGRGGVNEANDVAIAAGAMGLMILTVSDTVPCARGPFGVHGFPGYRQTAMDGARGPSRLACWVGLLA